MIKVTILKLVIWVLIALFVYSTAQAAYEAGYYFLKMFAIGTALLIAWWYQSDWRGGLYRLWRIARWTALLPVRVFQNWLNRKGWLDGISWPTWRDWIWRRTTTAPQGSPVFIVKSTYPRLADQLTFLVNMPVGIILMLLVASLFTT